MMLFKLIFASLVGVAVCELFDAEFFPFALLARALRGNTRRRQRTRYSFPRLQGRRPPGRMTTGVAGPPRVMSDPADISNMLAGRCSQDNPATLAHMFQDMFVSNDQADAMVQEAKTNLRYSDMGNKRMNSFIETERMSKTIGRVNSYPGYGNSNPGYGNSNLGNGNSNAGNSNPGNGNSNSGNSNPGNSNPGSGNSSPGNSNPGNSNPGSGTCCETEMRITAPFTVLERGKRMQVVHMNSSYQFVHEGVCVNPRTKCRSHGECVQVYKYAFMLLYDPELMRMYPPVRFGRVQVKSHCECMNIGV